MTRLRLRYVNEFRDRHGRVRRYFRRRGRKPVALPGLPGSAEFMEAYQLALSGLADASLRAPIGAERSMPGTVAAAIAAYYQHRSFKDELAPETQQMRRRILENFRAAHGDKRLRLLARTHVAVILGGKSPNAAKNWLKALRGLMRFALEIGLADADPTSGIRRIRAPRSAGFHAWSEAEIAQYEGCHAVGTRPRLAMALLLYTALRRGDIVRLGPQHFAGGRITLRKTARRTGKTLLLPVHPALAEILAQTSAGHLTYLVTAAGAPFTPAGFGNWFRQCCNAAGLPHCTAHGLRKAMLRRVAEAGGSTHHLRGLGGHASLSELQLYTADADQARLAQAAIDLVAEAFPAAKTGTAVTNLAGESYKPRRKPLK